MSYGGLIKCQLEDYPEMHVWQPQHQLQASNAFSHTPAYAIPEMISIISESVVSVGVCLCVCYCVQCNHLCVCVSNSQVHDKISSCISARGTQNTVSQDKNGQNYKEQFMASVQMGHKAFKFIFKPHFVNGLQMVPPIQTSFSSSIKAVFIQHMN